MVVTDQYSWMKQKRDYLSAALKPEQLIVL